MIMWEQSQGVTNSPVSVTVNGKRYGFRLAPHRSVLPFTVELDKLDVIKYQGSETAREYNSRIVYRSDNVKERSARVEMNEPFRADGYTLYQAQWSAAMDEEGREASLREHLDKEIAAGKKLPYAFKPEHQRTSIYQVVSNPADQLPRYCLYVCAIALAFHFIVKLVEYISSKPSKKKENA